MQSRRKRSRAEQYALLLATVCPLLLLASGCGGVIVGHWYLVKAVPSKEVFAIDDAYFARDGSFTATITIEGKTAREKGTYEFNGFKLTMRPQAGGQRRYNAVVKLRTLEVLDGERKVILKKAKKSKESDEK
ncbi:MAG: hypothetical protein ACE5I3_07430 [Phycisphaerae bacterium]